MGNPPIPPGAARKAADRAVKELLGTDAPSGWERTFHSIHLQQFRELDWVWIVKYRPSWKGHDFGGNYELAFYVPMNGVAIAPKLKQGVVSSEVEEEKLKQRAERELAEKTQGAYARTESQSWTYWSVVPYHGDAIMTPDMLAAAPSWDLSEPNPPLAFSEAMHIAQAVVDPWLPQLEERNTQLVLREVALDQLQGDKWVWVFKYDCCATRGFSSGLPIDVSVPVLMDGKAVEPVNVESAQKLKP